MPYTLPRTEFQSHPPGQHEGVIYSWTDRGTVDTAYGPKHRGAYKIESFTAKMDDGRPFIAYESLNISGGKGSRLRQRRTQILGRALEDKEALTFDPKEIIEVRVGYTIVHEARRDGDGVWANIDAIWRLEDQKKGKIENPIEINETPIDEIVLEGEEETTGGDIDGYREYIVGLIDLCAEHNIMDAEASAKWAAHIAETDNIGSFRLFASDFEGKLMSKRVKFERVVF